MQRKSKLWRQEFGEISIEILLTILGLIGIGTTDFFSLYRFLSKDFIIAIVIFILFLYPYIFFSKKLGLKGKILIYIVVFCNLFIYSHTKGKILDIIHVGNLEDLRYEIMRPSPIQKKIVIVMIDDTTKKKYGSNIDNYRNYHAKVFSNIAKQKPKVVGLDIFIPDKSTDYPGKADSISSGDSNLALALDSIYCDFIFAKSKYYKTDPVILTSLKKHFSDDKLNNHLGQVVVQPDPDGKVREAPMILKDNNNHFALLVWLAAINGKIKNISKGKLTIILEDGQQHKIPISSEGELFIQYNQVRTKTLSYGNVYQGFIDDDVFTDKIVLIGGNGKDKYHIPGIFQEEKMYGVKIIANIIATLSSGFYVKKPHHQFYLATILVILAFNIGHFVRFLRKKTFFDVLLFQYLLEISLVVLIVVLAQLNWNIWFEGSYIIFSIIITYALLKFGLTINVKLVQPKGMTQ